MINVRDTFVLLERQCLGTDVPCSHGRPFREWHGHCWTLIIQYEIDGPSGGVCQLLVGPDDGELLDGRSAAPDAIVRASADDWFALWSGRETARVLLLSGSISVTTVGTFSTALRLAGERAAAELRFDLPLLGILGPLRESEDPPLTRMTPRWEDLPDDDPYPPGLDAIRLVRRRYWPFGRSDNGKLLTSACHSPRLLRLLMESGRIEYIRSGRNL